MVKSTSPSRPPRLLFLAERFPPDLGGVARSAGRIAGALGQVGAEVSVVTWTRSLPAGAVESLEAPGGLTVHRLGLYAHLDFSMQSTLVFLDGLHRRHPFAAIWGHYLFPAGFIAVLTAETFGIPSAVSARGNDVDRMIFPPGDFGRLEWTLRRATIRTAVSTDLAEKIRIILGRPAEVDVLHNAVDTETFHPAPPETGLRQSLGIRPDEAVLGFSGELRQKKGMNFLLKALVDVRRHRPACLLIVGEVRAREQAEIARFAAECPDDHARLIVTGHLEEPAEVARHVRLCDLMLLPSLWDGLPNSLLEAMACERICIASDAGGIPEVIEHGRDGLLVARSELHRLGEAVLEVLAQPDETRASIGSTARERVQRDFTLAGEQEDLRGILRDLIHRTGTPDQPSLGADDSSSSA